MKDLDGQRQAVKSCIQEIDDCAYWFQLNPHYLTDEIGIMFENSISRLQALESAITIKMREIAEHKLAEAMAGKVKSKERISAIRKQIEESATKTKASAKHHSRTTKNGGRGSRSSQAKPKR